MYDMILTCSISYYDMLCFSIRLDGRERADAVVGVQGQLPDLRLSGVVVVVVVVAVAVVVVVVVVLLLVVVAAAAAAAAAVFLLLLLLSLSLLY